ncbi:MAG: imidazolonepropionase [Phycisphaerales bacterium]|nr:imidazolonepropionase [Phycisphaerales bacterium]
MLTLIHNARVLTLAGDRPRRGASMRDLGVIDRADVLIVDDRISLVAPSNPGIQFVRPPDVSIDAKGRVLMPALVDCHTHACWAGSRIDEWERKLAGATYLEILQAGGGIMSTVRATRAATEDQLVSSLSARLARMLAFGTTTIEVKSGYGLSAEHERKMLRAIGRAEGGFPGTVVPTALIAHAIDNDRPGFIEATIHGTLDAVHAEFPGIAVDAYCEKGAWSLADCARLFERARSLGHPIRVHTNQFNSLGMVEHAAAIGAVSCDHLEAMTDAEIRAIGASLSIGVVLPAACLHLGSPYASARRMIDAGAAIALATNCNPGSAPTESMPLAMAMGVRGCGMTPAESIVAATLNPACVLGLGDRGQVAPGQRADLVLLADTDERAIVYELGGPPISHVFVGGKLVRPLT